MSYEIRVFSDCSGKILLFLPKYFVGEAKEQAGVTWKEFDRMLQAPKRADSIVFAKSAPNAAYAFALVKCVREHRLCYEIPEIIGEESLLRRFGDNPSDADEDALNTFEEVPDTTGVTLIEAMALTSNGIERATKYRGRYLFILSLLDGKFVVYNCVLFKHLGKDGSPRFSMWRETEEGDRREYTGAYFISDDQLFLMGGRFNVVDIRMSIFRINQAEDCRELEGLSLFVASNDLITSSTTYLLPMKNPHPHVPDRPITRDELMAVDEYAFRYLTEHPFALTQAPIFE